MQGKVRGGLEATEKAASPTVATVEGAAHEVTAAVCEVVGRVFWPCCEVGSGGGARVGCGLLLEVELGAGSVPLVLRSPSHGLPLRRGLR